MVGKYTGVEVNSWILNQVNNIFFVTDVTHSRASVGPQLYNSEALPFTYDQYVVIKLADKLYNSVTVCFYVSPWIFIQINNFPKLPAPGIKPRWIILNFCCKFLLGTWEQPSIKDFLFQIPISKIVLFFCWPIFIYVLYNIL